VRPRALREQLPGNDIVTLQPLMVQVLEAIPTAARGKVTNIKG
jgi:hypothetical protein